MVLVCAVVYCCLWQLPSSHSMFLHVCVCEFFNSSDRCLLLYVFGFRSMCVLRTSNTPHTVAHSIFRFSLFCMLFIYIATILMLFILHYISVWLFFHRDFCSCAFLFISLVEFIFSISCFCNHHHHLFACCSVFSTVCNTLVCCLRAIREPSTCNM